MQITQIQNEIIGEAHTEGQIKPDDVVRLLLHDPKDVNAAIQDLVNRGLLENTEGDAYRLTDQGQAVHRAQEDAHRAAVISRTSSWQRG
jgi:Mn-dependent DtxR family transcriptional regulator